MDKYKPLIDGLKREKITIKCNRKEEAQRLMEIMQENGIGMADGRPATDMAQWYGKLGDHFSIDTNAVTMDTEWACRMDKRAIMDFKELFCEEV